MSEDLDYEEMHRRIREKYETPPRKVLDYKEPYVPIEHSIRNSPKFDYLGDPDHWPEEGDTGDYEDDDYYESDEYADEATAELEEMKQRIQENMAAAKAATPRFMGVQSIEIPQSQEEARQKYQNILEEMKVDAGARGQATTKPEPKPPTRSGYARVTAPERETFFAPWETEGWGPEDPLDRPTDAPTTEEGLKRIGAHPSQKKTLPPMDTTRKHTVADKERRAQQVAERQATGTGYANEGGFDFSTVDTSATREKIAGLDRAAKDANLADTNTDIYKEHLPEELHNDPDALREAAKDAAAENYFNMMEKHGSEQGWADVEIDGEPWKETWFKDGETFFVSEDESQILRAPDAQKS